MTTATSYLLQMPAVPPEPTPGCVVCASLGRQRTQARSVGDYSRVSDCNVRMGAHTCRLAEPCTTASSHR
ncbi:hypothetical protein [Streptomyces sp. NPDC047042]|uniref:hypothetical protein n=1 Tax=Streptomyces sp. NPDC047042 TaxID=3154807 RepID=UPI0033C331CD